MMTGRIFNEAGDISLDDSDDIWPRKSMNNGDLIFTEQRGATDQLFWTASLPRAGAEAEKEGTKNQNKEEAQNDGKRKKERK